MKTVLVGCVSFSHQVLKKLVEMNWNVSGVVTRAESKQNSDFDDLTPTCRGRGIPYLACGNINDEAVLEWVRALEPEVILCVVWSQIIKKPLLSIPSRGAIGFHPAALPSNRGRHPLIWALFLGLDSTATTFFLMDEGADSGPIISQKELGIDPDDDAASLYSKMEQNALVQLEEFLPAFARGSIVPRPQEHQKSNNWRKRGVSDGVIDFRMCSRAIHNLTRALARPYPGAHVDYRGSQVKIWRTSPVNYEHPHLEPGKVLESCEAYVRVKTYDGAIDLVDHEFAERPLQGDYL